MPRIVDVTNVFWRFVSLIARLPYHKLQKTRLFETISDCVLQEKAFILRMCGIQFMHNDVNSLFYDTRDFLATKPEYADSWTLLQMAIDKIEYYVQTHESATIIEDIEDAKEASVSELDDLLARLSI